MRLALVGSGSSLREAARGQEIDAADAVMRLFDCRWHQPEDHGAKWTYGLIPGPWRRLDFARYVRDLATGPTRKWMAYHFGNALPALPRNTDLIDVRRWNGRGASYSGNPDFRITRGFAMFLAAASLEGITGITGYGFDAIAAGTVEGYSYHPGWRGPIDIELARKRHDFGAERRMLDDLRAETGIAIDLK